MLKQAVLGRSGSSHYSTTTARVIKELVPGNEYGELLKGKMIDFAVTLGPPLIPTVHVINRLATSLAYQQPLHLRWNRTKMLRPGRQRAGRLEPRIKYETRQTQVICSQSRLDRVYRDSILDPSCVVCNSAILLLHVTGRGSI